MEVVKCGLCKEEIEYSQRCRVYIKTDTPENISRASKRARLGRYKLISTASSTEHISFARRLKILRNKRKALAESKQELPCDKTLKICLTPIEKLQFKDKLSDKSLDKESLPEETLDKTECIDKESSTEKTGCLDKNSPREINNSEKVLKEVLINKKKNSTKPAMNHPQFQSSFEEYIKPILNKSSMFNKLPIKESDSSSDLEVNRKGAGNTYKAIKNGTSKLAREFDTYYWLDVPKTKAPEPKKLGYQFQGLVNDVKHMKLPSTQWKIKIMVHKQEMVSVNFSNRQTPEKLVNIIAKNFVCDIMFNNKKIQLIGAPVYIYSIKDVEVLLEIIDRLDMDSSLVQYL